MRTNTRQRPCIQLPIFINVGHRRASIPEYQLRMIKEIDLGNGINSTENEQLSGHA